MKKFFKYLPWVLLGISILAIWILLIGINYIKKDAVQQIKNIKAVEDKFQATRTAYDAQLETLKDDLDKAQAARDVYAEQLQTAEDRLACANKNLFKPDYIDDAGMSKALSEYLTATEGGVQKTATWYHDWENTKSARLEIILINDKDKSEVGYSFIIYHNDAYFAKNRVFSISRQCWLDG